MIICNKSETGTSWVRFQCGRPWDHLSITLPHLPRHYWKPELSVGKHSVSKALLETRGECRKAQCVPGTTGNQRWVGKHSVSPALLETRGECWKAQCVLGITRNQSKCKKAVCPRHYSSTLFFAEIKCLNSPSDYILLNLRWAVFGRLHRLRWAVFGRLHRLLLFFSLHLLS